MCTSGISLVILNMILRFKIHWHFIITKKMNFLNFLLIYFSVTMVAALNIAMEQPVINTTEFGYEFSFKIMSNWFYSDEIHSSTVFVL